MDIIMQSLKKTWVNIKKEGKVALIDIPVGEKSLRNFIQNPKYRTSSHTLMYKHLASASKFLNKRMETSGETAEMIKQRIEKASEDQQMLQSYLDVFNGVHLVREYQEDFLKTYAKQMIWALPDSLEYALKYAKLKQIIA